MPPKHVLLGLLAAAPGEAIPVAGLIRAAAVLDIPAGGVRVTLNRLARTGMVERAVRGHYRLGPAAAPVARQVAGWREKEARGVSRWSGAFAAVVTGGLGRSDRGALRRRERALRLVGFRAVPGGLALRPDNLTGGIDALRCDLLSLGLDEGALVLGVIDLPETTWEALRTAYDPEGLAASYRDQCRALEQLGARLEGLPVADAARRAFVAGNEAIRRIVADPLLPAPMVDVPARRAFVAAMRRFDRLGRRYWSRVLGVGRGRAAFPVAAVAR